MTNLITAISTIASLICAYAGMAMLRRTRKQSKQPFTPVSTTILSVNTDRGPNLPTYDPKMKRLGLARFNRNNR